MLRTFILFALLLIVPSAQASSWQPLWQAQDNHGDQEPWPESYDLQSASFLSNGTHVRIHLGQGSTTESSPRNSYRVIFRTPGQTNILYCDIGNSTPLDGEWNYCSGSATREGSTEILPGVQAVVERGKTLNLTNITFALKENGIEPGQAWTVEEIRSEVVLATSFPLKQQLQVTTADQVEELGGEFRVGSTVSNDATEHPAPANRSETPFPGFGWLAALFFLAVLKR